MTFVQPGGIGQLQQGVITPTSAWSTASLRVNLSDGNRTGTGNDSTYNGMLINQKTVVVTPGSKFYLEITFPIITTGTFANARHSAGVLFNAAWNANPSTPIVVGSTTTNSSGLVAMSNGWVFYSGSQVVSTFAGIPASGDVIGIVVGQVTGNYAIWFRAKGLWAGSAGNPPATPDLSPYTGFPYPVATVSGSTSAIINTGDRPFTYSLPPGGVPYG